MNFPNTVDSLGVVLQPQKKSFYLSAMDKNPMRMSEAELANVANHEDFEFVALSGAPPQLVTPKFTLGTVELGEYIYKNESI